MKTKEIKRNLLEQLKRVPIVQFACEKVGLNRSSYYRWRKEDKAFARLADDAISDGSSLINDMAESQLLSLIKKGNITAIIYWLKNHHSQYAEKLHTVKEAYYEELKPEQIKLLKIATEVAKEEYDKSGIPPKTDGAGAKKERDPADWDHF
ncbi:MAG: hypothetical protein PHV78_02600 [Patescibacteria group bacterium]|nr:hypothetical protein [Patescibacteria group bacterium]MDD5121720.1 hypothetical protein [Patescibacteria group bacterium]MDD5221715.1 hypothetical protein [Patescibacteria group bacterium]MDD5396116.1 hypothetical protein [Patescibacteria group bacterium]